MDPKRSKVFDPESKTIITDFTLDRAWKQFDENGYIMLTLTYEKGELIKIIDDKGNELGIDTNPLLNSENE
ncbi:MAG: hypothetical protein MK207_02410 [Saprospiraceae bacterium]|nr:hypothetical protein [Saprospiraceae bacterium]